ncbi:MAG: alpha/beta hydrolase [Spirochaetes bacterium]|nr:alpha/beta hydrolase [Spirochaetota bacterium]
MKIIGGFLFRIRMFSFVRFGFAFQVLQPIFYVSCRHKKVRVNGIPAEWVAHDNSSDYPVILYLHGGGFVFSSARTHRNTVARILHETGGRALTLDYRLAPEHQFPAAPQDVFAAYHWLLANNFDPSRIAVIGDSAGGSLVISLLQTLRDRKMPMPACGIALSAFADMTNSGESMKYNAKKDPVFSPRSLISCSAVYAGNARRDDPAVSPLFGKFNKLPPLLFQVGTDECLLDDTLRMYEKAKKARNKVELEVYDGMFHDFQMVSRIVPDGTKAIRNIGTFVKKHIG